MMSAYHQNGGGGRESMERGGGGGYSGDDRDSRSGDDLPDSDLGDKPVYLLEHLATFTVNKETGIVYPADGMRKLLQLEKTTGIWSQKMQLCLDRTWILIMDYETGNIIERFPATLIQEPTAFTSNDPMEMYNNILVFIVGGGGVNSRSEMHIFQCQSISAVHLVEDLKHLRAGKYVTQLREPLMMPPPQAKPGKQFPGSSGRIIAGDFSRDKDRDDTDSELGGLNDDNDNTSTSSEKYERDVTVLNHCFDDIEKFIARLQHSAAALRELERRRRNRKSKKKDPGEGLLTLRTRPPHEKEFIDIFAKFKLSFNLLAKLKAHIHDPNAPELVHFLFTPLALIVDASHETYYDPNLPARVIHPLLTSDAINLLINCVTSKETELWRSLGDAWVVPRDQWKGSVSSYHPVFFDGWSPEYPVIDELEQPSTPTNMQQRRRIPSVMGVVGNDGRSGDYGPADYSGEYSMDQPPSTVGAQQQMPPISPGLRDFSARSDISLDSIERNGGQMHAGTSDAWLADLQARFAKIVQVTYPRTANNDKELTVVRGEFLEVLDDTRKWWKARNSRGKVAHVPHTIVTPYQFPQGDGREHLDNGEDLEREQMMNQKMASVDRVRNKHIVPKGNRKNSDNSSYDGDVFHQPNSTNNVSGAHNNINHNKNRNSKYHSNGSSLDVANNNNNGSNKRMVGGGKEQQNVPVPPPPPPAATTPTTPTRSRSNTMSRKSISSTGGGQDEMQEELKAVLTLFREKRRLDIMKTPEIYIQQSSSAKEVEEWLRAKGFSERVIKKLNGFNGNELFALRRSTLEEYCGSEEGKRLASQITIQRNVSGYKTARSSELQAILAKARQKSELSQESDY